MPLRLTCCGESAASSVIVNIPLWLPDCVGVKVTPIVHDPVGATAVPEQVSDETAKSPDTVALLMCRSALPVFCTVNVCAPEVWLTSWLPKSKGEGLTDATGTFGERVEERAGEAVLARIGQGGSDASVGLRGRPRPPPSSDTSYSGFAEKFPVTGTGCAVPVTWRWR